MSDDLREMIECRQRLLDAVEDINRICDARHTLPIFENLATGAERMLEAWKREHCTKVMAGGGYCGWSLEGYDGETCGHND